MDSANLKQAQFLRELAREFKGQLSKKDVRALVANAANLAAGTRANRIMLDPKPIPKSVRKNLKDARLKRGMTHKDVAERADISPCYYTMIENGQRTPALETGHRITRVVGCKIGDVMWLDDYRQTEQSPTQGTTRQWLIDLRGRRTQEEVAKTCGISQNFYSCIERGECTPSVDIAKRMGEVLGFDWVRFFDSNLKEVR